MNSFAVLTFPKIDCCLLCSRLKEQSTKPEVLGSDIYIFVDLEVDKKQN